MRSIAALQAAISSAAAGDEIVAADGTYLNNTINISTSGIIVRAATPGGVFLHGNNAITISANRIVFSGFQFTSGSIAGVVITVTGNENLLTHLNVNGYSAQKYISIQAPSQRNQIAYSNFENKLPNAPIGNLVHIEADATVPGYHRIHRCSFQNLSGGGGDFGNEPIRLSNGAEAAYASRTVVEYCYWNNIRVKEASNIFKKAGGGVILRNPNGGTTWAGNSYDGTMGMAITADMERADPLLDTNGRPRPGDRTQKDIGCVEYTTGTIANRPLTLAGVGPSYLAGPSAGPVVPSIATQPH